MKNFRLRLFGATTVVLAIICILSASVSVYATNDGSLMYKNSEFIEKEQPELTEVTKKLISAYQKEQSMENYLKLRDEVIKNYNAVLDKKEQKLAELIKETQGKPNSNQLVQEMQEIVQEMYITYWNRINSSMLRFTDSRLSKWKISNASNYEYIPVMGAGTSISIKRTPVTNKEYAKFITETGYQSPSNWTNGTYAQGEDDLPVNYISYKDAEEYSKWLTAKDGSNTYRLPTESEWELAAGHMPKDADFNNGVNSGRTPVNEYADRTRGAHGAVDFWGNVWEWTSTQRDDSNILAVKGGSWKSPRTDSRTEHRQEGRDKNQSFDDVGFRIIQVTDGKEPEQKAGLYTLDTPKVTIKNENGDLMLSWNKVDKVVEYQIFEYDETTKLFKMLDRVATTSHKIENAPANKKYVVQALSYTAISDNVRPITGITQTGWQYLGNKWYYFRSSGAMVTGWYQEGSTWYYLDQQNGDMKTGWKYLGNKWYYFRSSGAMATGWYQEGSTWYYLDQQNGDMKTGWKYLGNKWYYLRSSGAMLTGWFQIGGKWYYAHSSGALAVNTTIDGYTVNANGEWV